MTRVDKQGYLVVLAAYSAKYQHIMVLVAPNLLTLRSGSEDGRHGVQQTITADGRLDASCIVVSLSIGASIDRPCKRAH